MRKTVLLAIACIAATSISAARADTITDWNQMALDVMKAARFGEIGRAHV